MSVLTLAPPQTATPIVRGMGAATWLLRFVRDPVDCLCRMRAEHGSLLGVGEVIPWRRRPRLCAVAMDSQLNRCVLDNPEVFRTMGQVARGPKGSSLRRVRYGLTRMNGAVHRQQRQLVRPSFTQQHIAASYPGMVRIIDEKLRAWPLDRPVDLWQLLRQLSVSVASRALFRDLQERQAQLLSQIAQRQLNLNFRVRPWVVPLNVSGTSYAAMLKNAQRMEHVILEALQAGRGRQAGAGDILATLQQARDEGQITHDEMVGQATILFVGSYENVTNALTWTVFLLAQHPSAMAELSAELAATPGELPGELEQLESYRFLDMVVKESLRILPPVPFLLRAVRQDVPLGNLQLRRGDRVICSPYLTHHSPEIYTEPEAFRPQRWKALNPNRFEYLPFGAGPRACIGGNLATVMIKAVLAIALKRMRFGIVPGARIDRVVKVTMSPRFGMPVVIHRQDYRFQASPIRGNIRQMVELSESSPIV